MIAKVPIRLTAAVPQAQAALTRAEHAARVTVPPVAPTTVVPAMAATTVLSNTSPLTTQADFAAATTTIEADNEADTRLTLLRLRPLSLSWEDQARTTTFTYGCVIVMKTVTSGQSCTTVFRSRR